MNPMPAGERLAVLETQMGTVLSTLEKISSTQDIIKAKVSRAETQVTMGGTILKYAYPPGSALALWIAAHFSLIPLPR
jgi:hypothetical protein